MTLTRLELTATPFANGRPFGAAGAYEQLRGRAHFSLDPEHPLNAGLTDIQLVPREPDDRVHFWADVRILRPADPTHANRRLLLDVVNRGNPVVIRSVDASSVRVPDEDSAGWPLQQGYTVVACGWQHNVPPGTNRFALAAPEALADGRRLSGLVRYVLMTNTRCQVLGVADEASGAEHVAYPVADLDDARATLVERDYPLGPGCGIPRDQWRFARIENGAWVPDRTHIACADGFTPGKTYELIYTAEGAVLTGLGFAGLRDLVSFLRFASAGDGNPCDGQLDHALAFGTSQTGRLLRQFVYEGFCEDEEERLAIDGVLTNIAGPLRTEANWRFGQPSFIGADSPGFAFPFTDGPQTDGESGQSDSLLGRLTGRGLLPKVMHINTSAEYINLDLALIHLSADGRTDAPVPDNVRIYQIAGAHHGGGWLPLDNRVFDATSAYFNNSIDYRLFIRAALRRLDEWVSQAKLPPPSRYPRVSDGTLISRDELRSRLAHLPGPGMPLQRVYPTARLEWGPDVAQRRITQLPPVIGEAYPDCVPAVDDDGNERSGVRLPDVAVPLATYTGWNPREASIGGTQLNLLLNGSTIPFARTTAERHARGDRRPSIQERYASKDVFLEQIRASATALARDGYLLEEDIATVVAASGQRWDEFMTLESALPARSERREPLGGPDSQIAARQARAT